MIRSVKLVSLRAATLIALLVAACAVALGQQEQPFGSISYQLSMSRPTSHLFEVSIEVEGVKEGTDAVDFQMPRWSPGR